MSVPTETEPRPRHAPDQMVRPICWPVSRTVNCGGIVPPPDQSFVATLEARRSQRFMTQASLRELVNAVAFGTQPRETMEGDSFSRSRRPSPSAGALHPVDVLLVRGASRVFRYVPLGHRLQLLHASHPEHLKVFAGDCHDILPKASGTAIVLVGDMARVAAIYHRPESLLWRDSGALLQTLALVAAAYRLAFCPLGILGLRVVHAIGLSTSVSALGAALIGRPDTGLAAEREYPRPRGPGGVLSVCPMAGVSRRM